ncbi:MAG: HK97-gp10 family putative phage morphogenesis protein [Thermodesulfobacteriota bacterium]
MAFDKTKTMVDIERELEKRCILGAKKLSEMLEYEQKVPARVKTGRMKHSVAGNYTGSGITRTKVFQGEVVTVVPEPKEGKYVFTAISDTQVYYAKFVEFGTRRSRPYPFMRPGYEKVRQQANRIWTEALRG